MRFIIKVLVSGFAVILTAYLLQGVSISNYGYAVLTAFVISILNATVKPLFVLFTLPLTLLTLGLFLLVINSAIIMIADYFIYGFEVQSFWWALAFSLILSFINSILFRLIEKSSK